MRVYSENYISDTKNQITKLVLETHFEITMCAVLGMIQITQLDQATGSRFTPFFIYSSDQINSLLSMFHLVWMVVFPSYFTYRLVTQFHCLDQDKTREELEFLLEENKHDSRMRALYQVFFMSRRFLSVMVLVFMTDWPFFQCSFLMIFSTINLVYLIAHLPLLTNFENILNFINELSIVIFSHMMTNLLNPNIPESLFDSLGKGLISVVAINILINFIAIASQSIQSLLVEHRKKAAVLKIKQRFAARQKARQKLQQEFGMEFGHFNEYQQQLEALEFCREWKQHQKWLVKNKVKVDGFKEQEIYQ